MSESLASTRPAVTAWTPPPLAPAASFRDYVLARKYDYGRGSAGAWRFIAEARGDRDFPDARNWRELQAYLERRGASADLVKAARSVWRSFTVHRSRARSGPNGRS